jgi:hypothetical protein
MRGGRGSGRDFGCEALRRRVGVARREELIWRRKERREVW